jgi:hypothetical protein
MVIPASDLRVSACRLRTSGAADVVVAADMRLNVGVTLLIHL